MGGRIGGDRDEMRAEEEKEATSDLAAGWGDAAWAEPLRDVPKLSASVGMTRLL